MLPQLSMVHGHTATLLYGVTEMGLAQTYKIHQGVYNHYYHPHSNQVQDECKALVNSLIESKEMSRHRHFAYKSTERFST